jgi:polysaccharide biosynthesis/export protein
MREILREIFGAIGGGRLAPALLGCLWLAGCNAGGLGPDLPEPDSIRPNASFAESEYRISPQDVLEVNVFQFQNLSRTVQVDGAGRVSLPLIGALTAAGKTVRDFELELNRRYGERYLQSPQISVFVKESVGQRITVDGAVRNPGVFSLKGKTTLLQAIALAQGLNDVGDTLVTLTRTADQHPVSTRYDIAAIRSGKASDPLVYGGDVISIDESASRTALQVLKTTVPAAIGIGVKAVP